MHRDQRLVWYARAMKTAVDNASATSAPRSASSSSRPALPSCGSCIGGSAVRQGVGLITVGVERQDRLSLSHIAKNEWRGSSQRTRCGRQRATAWRRRRGGRCRSQRGRRFDEQGCGARDDGVKGRTRLDAKAGASR
jgi:hypothetical protein